MEHLNHRWFGAITLSYLSLAKNIESHSNIAWAVLLGPKIFPKKNCLLNLDLLRILWCVTSNEMSMLYGQSLGPKYLYPFLFAELNHSKKKELGRFGAKFLISDGCFSVTFTNLSQIWVSRPNRRPRGTIPRWIGQNFITNLTTHSFSGLQTPRLPTL